MAPKDPYYDDSVGVLRNLLGAKSPAELEELEAQVAYANQIELASLHIPRTNDLNELCAIHEQIFKGIYDWAGQIRTVDIRKNEEGSEYFLIVSKLSEGASYVFNELTTENNLMGDIRKKGF